MFAEAFLATCVLLSPREVVGTQLVPKRLALGVLVMGEVPVTWCPAAWSPPSSVRVLLAGVLLLGP